MELREWRASLVKSQICGQLDWRRATLMESQAGKDSGQWSSSLKGSLTCGEQLGIGDLGWMTLVRWRTRLVENQTKEELGQWKTRLGQSQASGTLDQRRARLVENQTRGQLGQWKTRLGESQVSGKLDQRRAGLVENQTRGQLGQWKTRPVERRGAFFF